MTNNLADRCEAAGGADEWIDRAFPGIDAEFVRGMNDGRDLTTPEPTVNRHPAYRHAWEVHRAEVEGWVIPAAWARGRAKHIEAGGDFYPYPYRPTHAAALRAKEKNNG